MACTEGGTMLSDLLQSLCDEQKLTPKELALTAAVGRSTAYRWLSGESQPTFDQLCVLVRDLPLDAGMALLRKLTEATDYRIDHPDEAINTDLNGDGVTDLNDVIDGSVQCCDDVHKLLAAVRESTRDHEIDQKDLTSINSAGASMERSGKRLLRAASEAAVIKQKAKAPRLAK